MNGNKKLASQIVEALLEKTSGPKRRQNKNFWDRSERVKQAKMEEKLAVLLSTQSGQTRIAQAMEQPVRQIMDYQGFTRQFSIVEDYTDGVPLYFDRDVPDLVAVALSENGSTAVIEARGTRVDLEEFELVNRSKVPYRELYVRRYRTLDRTKEKMGQGMMLGEDLVWLALIDIASSLGRTAGGNDVINSTGGLTRSFLSRMFAELERNRLEPYAIIMSPFGIRDVRNWNQQDISFDDQRELLHTGYLGTIWNTETYVSTQIPSDIVYVVTNPEFLSWLPIRKDIEVIPADDPDNLQLGFIGYELLGMIVHNPLGVVKGNFNAGQGDIFAGGLNTATQQLPDETAVAP